MSPSDSIQVTAASTATPANITEFNTIAGLIFAQFYAHFPVVIDPDRQAIANSFGVGRLALIPPNGSCFRKRAWPHSTDGVSTTVGSSLVKASSEADRSWSGIGDLVGGI